MLALWLVAAHKPLYIERMGKHHHHEFSGVSLREEARKVLQDCGEQWTEMRASIYDALAGQEKPVSAYDIADAVSAARGKRVAPNSIYRILDLFVANNLAIRVESANAYIVNAHPGCVHDCIFLVCSNCQKAIHVDDDSLSASVRARAAAENFVAERPIIEVQGLCTDCQKAA